MPTFKRIQLSSEFTTEGASFGDFDNDGHGDVVAGPYVYLGPDFTESLTLYELAAPFDPKGYSDNFFAFPYDFDGDGWLDVLFVGFPGQSAYWHQNPGAAGGLWPRHVVFAAVDNESPTFVDVTGDGKPELVCASGGKMGWAAPDWSDPTKPWTFREATDDQGYVPFTHGMGAGDVNGDGRVDLLEKNGVWLAPPDLATGSLFTFQPHALGNGGAQMFATDVDGDGTPDIVTSLSAHGYGVAWFEQVSQGNALQFVAHEIASANPNQPAGGVLLHEPHALTQADVDGDGLLDVITGERFWGHANQWPDSLDAPASLYWFELRRGPDGPVYIPHLIDDASGVGTQVVAGDIDGDGRVDVVVANKKGVFVFLQQD